MGSLADSPTSAPASPVLVTGAGGFIGSHLAERCAALGCRVRAFVHYNAQNRWGWLDGAPLAERMEIVAGDVRDYDAVRAAMDGCASVFHLAALIGIPYSYRSPLAYLRTNVEGTYNVLQAARELGVANVVVTSTSEVYGSAQYVPIDERHPVIGQSPYSASKIAADQLALSFHRSFELPVRIVRPFNAYGPRQSARAFIPTVATQILAGERTLRLGNLAPTRDLTHVADTVEGFLAAAACPGLIGETVNVGSETEIAMGELAKKIAALMDAEVTIQADPQRIRPGESEVDRLRADATKLREAAGWRPRFDLDDGLRETIDWLREHRHAYKADIYNI